MTKKNSSPMKKLIPAAGMLMVSTMMLASSTYAWFSMNKDVTVKGMSVTAKSDSAFLLVKAGTQTSTAIQSAGLIEDNATTASAQLYPAAHHLTPSDSIGITTIEAADAQTAANTASWYYKYSSDPGTYIGNKTSDTVEYPVTVAGFGNYVLVNEFSLTTAVGSNELENLRVKSCTLTTEGDAAVKVIVAGANGCQEFDASTGADISDSSTVLQSAHVASGSVSTVKVYAYWDGNDTDVYTNGVADLKNTAVTVVLTGDIVPAT